MNCMNKCLFFIILVFLHQEIRPYILGSQNQINSVVLQSDGKTVAAGFTVINNVQYLMVTRYTTTGQLDSSFGINGAVTVLAGESPIGYGIKIDANGSIVIVGSTIVNNASYIVLIRLTSNGSLDNSFGINGVVLSLFESGCGGYALWIDADQKIIVTGTVIRNNEVYMPLIRYNSDGSVDTSFADNGISIIDQEDCAIAYALTVQPDGKFLLAGFAESQGIIARCLSDGRIDTSFGNGGISSLAVGFSSTIRGIDLQSKGSIVVGGFSNGQCLVARFQSDGVLDARFADNGIALNNFAVYNVGLDMDIDKNDRIILAGLSDASAIVCRYTADGQLDTSFGNQGVTRVDCGVGNVNTLAIQNDEKIIIAGFTDNNAMLARVNTDGTFDKEFGVEGLVLDPTDYFPGCGISDNQKGYVFSYDTTTQTVSIANTFQDITLNTNAQLVGWTHIAGKPIFNCVRSGLYQVTYNVVSERTSGSGTISASVRATLNSIEIPGSQLSYDFVTNSQTISPSKTFIASFNAGDSLKFQYSAGSTACRMIAGDGNGTTRCSITVSMIQIA